MKFVFPVIAILILCYFAYELTTMVKANDTKNEQLQLRLDTILKDGNKRILRLDSMIIDRCKNKITIH